MHDLAALGFGPSTIAKFSSLFPGGTLPAGSRALPATI